MDLVLKFLLFLTTFYTQANSHILPSILNYDESVNVGNRIVSYVIAPETGSFFYAICDPSKKPSRPNITCNVTKLSGFPTSLAIENSCSLSYQPLKEEIEVEEKLLRVVNEDRVILIRYVTNNVTLISAIKIHVIDINECRIREISLPIFAIGHIYPKKDIIEFVFQGPAWTPWKLCLTSFCRMRFDYDGNKLDDPVEYVNNIEVTQLLSTWNPIYIGSADEESYLKVMGYGFDLYKIMPNNSKTLVAQAKGFGLATSIINDVLSVCATDSMYVNCTRRDLKSGSYLDVKLSMKNISNLDKDSLAVTGLKDGGLMVLLPEHNSKRIVGNFTAIKIRSDGQTESLRRFKLDIEFDCNRDWIFINPDRMILPIMSIIEKNNMFCFQFICYSSPSVLKIGSKCVADNNFTEK